MSEPIPFELLSPADHGPGRREALARRELPASLGSHREAARLYRPDPGLVDAVNVALAVGAPLLLTGEPGTGKTQVGHYLAWYFGVELFPLVYGLVWGPFAVAICCRALLQRRRDVVRKASGEA